MKLLLLCALLSLTIFTYGQSKSSHSFRTKGSYLTFSMGETFLFPHPSTGSLDVSFPYSATSHTGTVQQTFSSSVTHLFSKPIGAFGLDFQRVSKNHFFDVDLGLGSHVGYFSFGYGRKAPGKERWGKRFNTKPSIHIGYYQFFKSIGSIDNRRKNITVLGHEADSTFRTSSSSRSPAKTYNAEYIDVRYVQQDFVITPKIAFEYHPFKNIFFIELGISYILPFSEIGKIALAQTNGANVTHKIDKFPLGTKDLTTTFNNSTITKTPFNFSGLQICLKVGI